MATQHFGLNRGERIESVSTGTSGTGKSIDLAIDDTAGLTRGEIEIALDTLQRFILDQRTTPFK
jgi:hypothetical protein